MREGENLFRYFFFFCTLTFLPANRIFSQGIWEKVYGGLLPDDARWVEPTTDGNFIVAGNTRSSGAGVSDICLLKISGTGSILWMKSIGGSSNEYGYCVRPASDGGYFVAGETSSYGSGPNDVYVQRLDAGGNLLWIKTYGGAPDVWHIFIQQTSDGGAVIWGDVLSFGSGGYDVYMIKTDADGNIQWDRTYGGINNDGAHSVEQTADGGYILLGWTNSFGTGNWDFYVLKLDSAGNIQWQKTYGGTMNDVAWQIRAVPSGGYIMIGYTNSFGAGSYDAYVLKTDDNGNIQWQRTFGGTNSDYTFSVQPTSDGGYISAGYTISFGSPWSWNVYVLKMDANGNLLWSRQYGGNNNDYAFEIREVSGGGYIVAGQTNSFSMGGDDIYVLRLDASGASSCYSGIVNTQTLVPATKVKTPVTLVTNPPTQVSTGGILDISGNTFRDVCPPLAAGIENFTAEYKEGIVGLKWTTYSEPEQYFILEKRNHEKDYSVFGHINAGLTVYGKTNFSSTDPQPQKGFQFYSVKQMSREGQILNVRETEIFIPDPGNSGIICYPNPVLRRECLTVEVHMKQPGTALISMFDCTGRRLYNRFYPESQSGLNTFYVPFSYFSKTGIYLLTLNSSDGNLMRRVCVY